MGCQRRITDLQNIMKQLRRAIASLKAQLAQAMKALSDCEEREQKLLSAIRGFLNLADKFTLEDLNPPLYPRQFGVQGWRVKIPDLGQWLGRYIPGQPYADGYDHNDFLLNSPLPYTRWALGYDPKDPNCWGLGEFALHSFNDWREIPVTVPAKPFFEHLSGAFKESLGRMAVAAVKVGILVNQIKAWRPPGAGVDGHGESDLPMTD